MVPLHEGEQPKSFKAAWRLVKKTSAWKELGDESTYNYILEIEAFLLAPMADGVKACGATVDGRSSGPAISS